MSRRPSLHVPALLAALALLAAPAAAAPPGGGRQAPSPQPAKASRLSLTVESIMRGPALVGYPPSGLRWSADSSELYFEWRRPGEDEASTWVAGRDGGEPRKLGDDARKLVPPAAGGQWDQAQRRVVFVEAGDIVLLDAVARSRQRITRTAGSESGPRWARRDTAVTFVRDGSLYLVPVASGLVEQVVDVQPRKRETRETDSQKYLKAEEEKLIGFTREAIEKRKAAEEKRKKEAPPLFETEEGQAVVDAALSPAGGHVFLLVNERPGGAKTADTPSYVTESAYSEMIPGRATVGDAQPRRRLAILNLATGRTVWADASFAGKRQAVQAPAQGGDRKEVDREVGWGMPLFPPDGALAVAWVRAADFKDRWIVAVDAESGKSRVIDLQHDDAWVSEGGFGPSGARNAGFLADGTRLFFTSEKDGWMHLHVVDASTPGAKVTSLTRGKWEVSSVNLSRGRTHFYFVSSERHPGERHLCVMPADGGEWRQLTTMPGSHAGEVSPDGRTIGLISSYSNQPPEVYLMPNEKGAAARKVTTTPTEEWRAFKWADPRVVTFKARDGAEVYARLYTPEMLGARRDSARPGVVFVHGAGFTQNVHRWWSSYYREYMFHNLLASRGYVVLDVDYRASAGYGRDWRTAIYRHMGGKDSRGHRGRREVPGGVAAGGPEAHRPVRGQLRRVHHADGALHLARHLRRRRRPPPGDRLGALQPRLQWEHPEPAAGRSGGLPEELADLLRRGAEGGAARLPRDGRHQRPLPGFGPPGAAVDRAGQGELGTGGLPGREPRVRGGEQLGGRVPGGFWVCSRGICGTGRRAAVGQGFSPAGHGASPAGHGASPAGHGVSPAGHGGRRYWRDTRMMLQITATSSGVTAVPVGSTSTRSDSRSVTGRRADASGYRSA